ncbi:MAG: hypothetical protein KBD01_15825 [Acidobacteria bacterium]|nr:hypothetical protein [Acidobacteriota bacterium]
MSIQETRRAGRLAALACALVAVGGIARAHVVPLDAAEMVHASRYIVVATVTEQHAEWNARHNLILTRVTLRVEDGLRGAPPRELVVTSVGGTLDGQTHDSCMSVRLETGRRYVLFVNDPDQPTFSTFTGAQAGVLAEVADPAGGPPLVQAAGGNLVEAAGGPPTFAEFVERLRAFVAETEKLPPPPPRARGTSDAPLPSKTYDASSAAFAAGTMELPAKDEPAAGPPAPGSPQVRYLDAGAAAMMAPRPDNGADFSYARAPGRYIVWNELSPALAPWSPHDQYMMSRWNSYGDIHRISGAPTGNWAWGNDRYDMTGWPSNQDMINQFGQGWGATELAICWTRWFGDGPIVEADISMNPAFGWTLDNAAATHPDGAWGYEQTVLHELGHSWGLAHPWQVQDVWWDSVMNYAPKDFRLPYLFADDTNAIRGPYPGATMHDGVLSLYSTSDTLNNMNATYRESAPTVWSVRQGDPFTFGDSFKLENVGTDNIVDPQVEVYLTPQRMSWSGYVYLQTLYYSFTAGVFQTWYLNPGSVYVPYSTPPGDYWVALWLRDAADSFTYNNEAWGTRDNSVLTITSYPWTLYPVDYWQYDYPSTGPNGRYEYYFYGYAGERYDLGTCPEDGAGAGYDTVMEVYGPGGGQVAYSDDACGLQSRVSFEAEVEGNYHVVLRGYSAADYGWATLAYRQRSFGGGPVSLSIYATDPNTGSIVVGWGGSTGPYDLERATQPDFSDAVRLLQDSWQTTYEDPVLSDGASYYYRAR